MLLAKLDLRFKEIRNGIQYYQVDLDIQGKKREIIMPRYHTFLGWIEVFGLPPQHEWCVLKAIKPFEKQAMLMIEGRSIDESVKFNTDPVSKLHSIVVSRKVGEQTETFHWFEDYSRAPGEIIDHGTFSHQNGIYTYAAKKRGFQWSEDLTLPDAKQQEFLRKIVAEHGAPDAVWLKTFEAKGSLPSLFYQMFPITNLVDLSKVSGWVCELGYMNKEGDEVDKVHGDWYKLLKLNDKFFFIKEGNYTSCEAEIKGKPTRIKNTYSKELHTYE